MRFPKPAGISLVRSRGERGASPRWMGITAFGESARTARAADTAHTAHATRATGPARIGDARNVLRNVDKSIGDGVRITVSAGAACGQGRRVAADAVIAAADAALYEAKRAGRNQVCMAPKIVT